MRFKTPLLAASAAAAFCAGTSSAQNPIDYAHHWAVNAEAVDVAISGPALFTIGPSLNFASTGDAIRRCYGVDTTQGGRNATQGQWANTTFRVGQGFAAGGTSIDIGFVSVHGASESDLGGDVCFAPFLQSAGNTGGYELVALALIGPVTGASLPFPNVWDIAFQWVGTTCTFEGVEGSTTLGSAGLDILGNPIPLLTNVIYEIQGPVNGGPNNNQYYLGSTTEVTGRGLTGPGLGGGYGGGTGGVTNGNVDWGSSLFAVSADVSGAIGHSRVIASDPAVGTLFATTLFGIFNPVTPLEWNSYLGFQAPGLWATNDLGQAQGLNEGAGGPDWNVSGPVTSIANLIYQNHLTGAQANTNVLFKEGLTGGGPTVANTTLGAPPFGVNFPIFVYSATPAITMQQRPLSWDDFGGAIPPQPNSIILGNFATRDGGNLCQFGGGASSMGVAANFDAVTNAFLTFATLTFGTTQVGSDDLFLDPGSANSSSYFEGSFANGYAGLPAGVDPNQNLVSGTSGWSGGAAQLPNSPNARGLRMGVHAAGLQVDGALNIVIIEMSNALTIDRKSVV